MRLKQPRTPLAVVAAFVACGFAPSAWSQSLMELYKGAADYDSGVLAARAAVQAAEFRVARTQGLNRPQVALTAGATVSRVNPSRGTANLDTGNSNAGQVALNGRLPLFNRSNDASIRTSELQLEDARQELAQAEQDFIFRLTAAYFEVLAAQDTLSTTRANKKAVSEQLASAKRNFEVGTATIVDAREAEARLDRATAEENRAENELRIRRLALDQLVGRSGVQPLPLAAPVTLPAVVPDRVDDWIRAAEANSPVVQRARIGVQLAGVEIDRAKAAEKPTVEATASYGAQRVGGELSALSQSTRTASLGVQFNLPLYTGGQTQNGISEALANEERARIRLNGDVRRVTQDARDAFFNAQSQRTTAQSLEAAERSAKLQVESTELGYRVGVRVNLDVLNAQSELFQRQRELATTRYQAVVTSLRLRQVAGQLTPGDIEAVDRLLAK